MREERQDVDVGAEGQLLRGQLVPVKMMGEEAGRAAQAEVAGEVEVALLGKVGLLMQTHFRCVWCSTLFVLLATLMKTSSAMEPCCQQLRNSGHHASVAMGPCQELNYSGHHA